jgi:hypothetical protein
VSGSTEVIDVAVTPGEDVTRFTDGDGRGLFEIPPDRERLWRDVQIVPVNGHGRYLG